MDTGISDLGQFPETGKYSYGSWGGDSGSKVPAAKYEDLGSDPQRPHIEAGAGGGGAQGDRDRRISRIHWVASTASP